MATVRRVAFTLGSHDGPEDTTHESLDEEDEQSVEEEDELEGSQHCCLRPLRWRRVRPTVSQLSELLLSESSLQVVLLSVLQVVVLSAHEEGSHTEGAHSGTQTACRRMPTSAI